MVSCWFYNGIMWVGLLQHPCYNYISARTIEHFCDIKFFYTKIKKNCPENHSVMTDMDSSLFPKLCEWKCAILYCKLSFLQIKGFIMCIRTRTVQEWYFKKITWWLQTCVFYLQSNVYFERDAHNLNNKYFNRPLLMRFEVHILKVHLRFKIFAQIVSN